MSATPDPALVAAVLEALAAKGYTITPPAEEEAPPSRPATPIPSKPTPEVRCHRCGDCCSRTTAREEGWTRTADGWVCRMHSPIDWSYAGDLASGIIDDAEQAFRCLMERDAAALEHIDELRYTLADLEAVTRPLRQKPAA